MKNKIKNIFHPHYETIVDEYTHKDNNIVILSILKNSKEIQKFAYTKKSLKDKEKIESFYKNPNSLRKHMIDLIY